MSAKSSPPALLPHFHSILTYLLPQIVALKVRHRRRRRDLSMAEVLAVLGGAAALTQLIHYGFVSVSTVSALSHNIRHTADKIDTWIDQSLLMTNLIDDIDCSIRNHTPSTIQLLGQCRNDAARLHTLLATCRKYMPSQKRSRASGTVFVIRKEEEVERIMSSYRNNFNILASYLAM